MWVGLSVSAVCCAFLQACCDFLFTPHGQSYYLQIFFHNRQQCIYPSVLCKQTNCPQHSGFTHSRLWKVSLTQWVKHNDSTLSESGFVLLLDGPASVFFGMTFSRNYVPCGSQHSVFHHDTIFVPMSPIILTSFTTPNHQLSSRKCARPTMAYWIIVSPPPPPPLFYMSPFCLTIALC